MAKYQWTPEIDGEKHAVSLRLSRLTGRTAITIDGSSYPLHTSPFRYFKERKEIFRLGEKQAILVIRPGKKPDIVIDRVFVDSGEEYS